MAILRLAGNYITGSSLYPGESEWGHLALVLVEDDGDQWEIEVQAPNFFTIPFGGDFVYPDERDHLTNTPNIEDPDGYAYSNISLTDGRTVDDVWDIFQQIHQQFSLNYTNIDYNLNQNSNAYANTLLSIVGIDINSYLAGATPDDVKDGFPSFDRNLLTDQVGSGETISLNIVGREGIDVLILGDGDDTIFGSAGNDTLKGGGTLLVDDSDLLTYETLDYSVDVAFASVTGTGTPAVYTATGLDPNGVWTDSFSEFDMIRLSPVGVDIVGIDWNLLTENDIQFDGLGASVLRSVDIDAYLEKPVSAFAALGDVLDLGDFTSSLSSPVRIVLGASGTSDGTVSQGPFVLPVANFSNMIGSSFAEEFVGNELTNYAFGLQGNDTLIGGEATDFLEGGDGDDVLYGGIWRGFELGSTVAPNDYEDDGAVDYLVGGTGNEIYYASAFDEITDAPMWAVDELAEPFVGAPPGTTPPRFFADGDGTVYFEGRQLTGGVRIPSVFWNDLGLFPPTESLNIAIESQLELFILDDAENGPLYFRVMNAFTMSGQGVRVDEYLLIVEDPNAGTAITITGVQYTPGEGLGEGFLGLDSIAQSQQSTLLEASGASADGVGIHVPAMDADAFNAQVETISASNAGLTGNALENLGLGDALNVSEPIADSGPSGSIQRQSGNTGGNDDTLLAAAKGPGGGGGGGNGGGGNGGEDPPPPPTGTGFLGVEIVNPDPIPDTTGDDNLRGGKNNDTLIATQGNDTLKGQGGDDLLEGGWDADSLDGGSGTDTASYVSSDAGVRILLYAGTASGGHAQGDVLTGIENVIGSGYADSLYGDTNDNSLIGYAGNDYFEGRGGNDTFDGGFGNDAVGFSWMSTGHVDVNIGTQSFGGVAAGLTYISIESFGGTNNAAEGDILIGSEDRNDLYGYAGDDTIQGLGGNDLLSGGSGQDSIDGGDGNDNIIGGQGADILSGGAGFNLFTFYGGDTGTSASTWDVITDFDALANFFDLSSIDADETNGDGFSNPNDGFRWVGTDVFFNGLAGDLRYEHVNGDTHLMGETDGDGIADFVIVLNGIHDLVEENFFGETVGDPVPPVDPIYGTEGADDILGTSETDLIYSLGGNDTIRPGSGGFDTVYGGDGDDQVYVGVTGGVYDSKEVHGDAGNDYLDMGLGNDTVFGGEGNDTIFGDQYHDLLFGDEGNDSLVGDLGTANGSDTLYGGVGDDTLRAGKEIDYFDGGDGIDEVFLADHLGSQNNAVIDLALDTASYDNGDVELILNIENVVATWGNDTIYGDQAANVIDGYHGDDVIHGRGRNARKLVMP